MKSLLNIKQISFQRLLSSVIIVASLFGSVALSVHAQADLFGGSGGGSGSPGQCPSSIDTVPKDFNEFICLVGGILNSLLPIVMAMTLLAFFWGLAKFIRNAGDPKEIQKGKDIMKWGIIALFVMVSFVGIINVFTGDFFGGTYFIPRFPESV